MPIIVNSQACMPMWNLLIFIPVNVQNVGWRNVLIFSVMVIHVTCICQGEEDVDLSLANMVINWHWCQSSDGSWGT